MRTLAIINQKGGCGKTTTSINLAAAMADLGRRTLLVDMDPQGHCGLGLAVPETQLKKSIADALLESPGRFDLQEILWQISANLDLAPATTTLAAAEHQLAAFSDRDLRLAKLLKSAEGDYDVCLIDCPPSIGLLTFNALRAAGEVVIPVETGYFALAGAIKQAATLQMLADRVAHEICFYVLPTMYDVRTKMAREIVAELRRHFGSAVLDIPIQFNTKLKEASSFGQPINEYDPASRSSQDFDRLARHLLSVKPVPRRIELPADAARRPILVTDPAPVTVAEAVAGPIAVHLPHTAAPPTRIPRRDLPAPTPEVAESALTRSPRSPNVGFPPGTSATPEAPAATIAAPPAPPIPPLTARSFAPKPAAGSRVADLVARAKALAERTANLQQKLAADPDLARLDAEQLVSPPTTASVTAAPTPPIPQPEIRIPQSPAPLAPPAPALDEKLRMYYGIRHTGDGVLFIQPEVEARTLCIAGDFNSWSPVATPMARDRRLGVWQAQLPLPPGRYRYRLIIDGQWTSDPHNPRVEINPFGETNNIVEVK